MMIVFCPQCNHKVMTDYNGCCPQCRLLLEKNRDETSSGKATDVRMDDAHQGAEAR